MCFPLASASSPFWGPSESFVITIGPGKKAVAQSCMGEEGNICGESGLGWLLCQSPVWLAEHRGRGGQLALMELILLSHCSARLAGWRHHQKNEAGWGVGTFSNVQPTVFPSFHGTVQLHKQEVKGSDCLMGLLFLIYS